MNYDQLVKKATAPIEKNRRCRAKPAKIRHLQKQQKVWMATKMPRKPEGRLRGSYC